mmetsp:Transcript_29767/g.45556  ORF Transcript_29767/g.45556 Transcript_29767/m.45556 type:complete len:165 (+) Transcript_29767:80-574(+)
MAPRLKASELDFYVLPAGSEGSQKNQKPKNGGIMRVIYRNGRKKGKQDIINFGFVKKRGGGTEFKLEKMRKDFKFIREEVIYDSIILPISEDLQSVSSCGVTPSHDSSTTVKMSSKDMWITETSIDHSLNGAQSSSRLSSDKSLIRVTSPSSKHRKQSRKKNCH